EPRACRSDWITCPTPVPFIVAGPSARLEPNLLQAMPIKLTRSRIRSGWSQGFGTDMKLSRRLWGQRTSAGVFPLDVHDCALPIRPRDSLVQRMLRVLARGGGLEE